MDSHTDILIIGGGVIGLTTAMLLADEGVRVTVLERAQPGRQASWAGAGIIPPGDPDRVTSPVERLRAFSVVHVPDFSESLLARTGIDNGYRRCGGLEILDGEDVKIIPRIWTAEGIPFERISRCEMAYFEPEIEATSSAVFHLPTMGQIRNPWHLRALIAGCQQANVIIRDETEVAGFERDSDQITGVRLADETVIRANQYLIAGGAWSESLLEPLGVRLGIHPVRGQIVMFRSEVRPFTRVLIIGKRYLVPREDGRTLIGSTEEPEAGFLLETTPIGTESLTAFAYEWVPTLREATIEQTWAGLRPGSIDGWPYMGPVPGWRNLSLAAGHFRAGLQLSVGTGMLMRDHLLGRTPALDLEPFRVDRTPIAPFMTAFRS